MSENKFENQVQHLMDELKFTPSEEVWPAIKNRIREKRRRRIFFFLIPLMAGLLVTGYYFLTKTNTLPVSQKEIVKSPVEKLQNSALSNENHITGNTPDLKNSITIQRGDQTSLPVDNDIEQTKIKANHDLVKINAVPNSFPIAKQNPVEEMKTPMGILDSGQIQSKTGHHTNEKILVESAVDQKTQLNINQNSDADNLLDSVLLNPDMKQNEIIPDSIASIKDTSKVVLIEKEKRPKWVWGIHVAVGASKPGSKTVPGFAPVAMDYNSSPNAGGPLFASPSKSSQTGTAIEAGLILKKQLTLRSSIATGLQYFYASDRILAGSRYDSTIRVQNSNSGSGSFNNTVRSYYRGNDQWYKNHYHYIELPLQYHYLLNKKSKIPVQLQAGLIFSQLLSTNGLVYDRALAGIYYEEKGQFNQSMLSLSSGINIQFNQKQKLKWSIGPQVRAGITSMRKAAYDQNKYLFSAGLRVHLFID